MTYCYVSVSTRYVICIEFANWISTKKFTAKRFGDFHTIVFFFLLDFDKFIQFFNKGF